MFHVAKVPKQVGTHVEDNVLQRLQAPVAKFAELVADELLVVQVASEARRVAVSRSSIRRRSGPGQGRRSPEGEAVPDCGGGDEAVPGGGEHPASGGAPGRFACAFTDLLCLWLFWDFGVRFEEEEGRGRKYFTSGGRYFAKRGRRLVCPFDRHPPALVAGLHGCTGAPIAPDT
jgi:hypothetical protein